MNPSTLTISHYTALISCEVFPDQRNIERIARAIVDKLKLQVVKKISYIFKPQGETLVWILSQSHLALHTYPEEKKIHIDLVCCLDLPERDFRKALKLIFKDERKYHMITKDCNF